MGLFGSLGQIGITTLLGAAAPTPQPDPMSVAVNAKVEALRARGLSVRPAPGVIPGLWEVTGHPELMVST